MYKLHTDKKEIFECDVQLSGASINKTLARLIIETPDMTLLFPGKINADGKCQIPIKRLKGLVEEDSTGEMKLEIIAEDTYFVPWTSTYKVQASKKVTVEVKSANSKENVEVKNVRASISESRPEVKSTNRSTINAITIRDRLLRESKIQTGNKEKRVKGAVQEFLRKGIRKNIVEEGVRLFIKSKLNDR